MREFYILRGVQGCGKSTLARSLALGNDSIICSADDYFMVNGVYTFNPENLNEAHAACQNKARQAVANGVSRIIIDNVHATTAQLLPYLEMANAGEYLIFSLIVEHRHKELNEHRVPIHTRMRTAQQMLAHIKLIFAR